MAEPAFQHPPQDIWQTLRHHDQQLGALTTEVGGIKSTLNTLVVAVSDIRSAVTTVDARRPIEFQAALGIALNMLVIASILIGGVVWISTSLAKPNTEAATVRDDFFRYRLEKLEAMPPSQQFVPAYQNWSTQTRKN